MLVVEPVLRPNSALELWVRMWNSAMASMGGLMTNPPSTLLTLSAPSITSAASPTLTAARSAPKTCAITQTRDRFATVKHGVAPASSS